MSIKLDMLRVFKVVAEEGSLARASAVLGRTPSAVSMMLAQLQDNVGAELFETDRKNRLTPLGALVLEEAGRAIDAFDRSAASIRRHAKSTAGLVRIAAVPSATIDLLPGVIARFSHQRPDVRLEISDVDTATVRRLVKLDEADIGILSAPAGEGQIGRMIRRDMLGIVCRTGGPISRTLATSVVPSWDLLKLEPLIENPLCHLVSSPVLSSLLPVCNLEARNTTALLAFVRSGMGATVLPESAIGHSPEQLEFVAPRDPESWRELRKIHGTDRHLSPAARAFWDLIGA
ncbi:LysR family transcriptional regulator [Paracoccus shandongensis]|uniref:LysR family transcriptional regulator n=1 Tax=Paracoccus shandongensis TaxID=2816048 RepID=UPI001A8C7B60|nr:LysR family transcriptional regulator [Paracoccus shandongensis]